MLFLSDICRGRVPLNIIARDVFNECINAGIKALPLVCCVTMLISAGICYQCYMLLNNVLITDSMILLSLKNMILLEIAPTLSALIFIGQYGLGITNSLFAMKISGQIDAVRVVGLNQYKIYSLPKVIAGTLMLPIVVGLTSIVALFVGGVISYVAYGAKLESILSGYIDYNYNRWYVSVFITKALMFGFLVSSISSFMGFTANERDDVIVVSKRTFNVCCIVVLISDIIITYYSYLS